MKLNNKNMPDELINEITSHDTDTDNRESYSLESVCDINGDKTADFVFSVEHYYISRYVILTTDPQSLSLSEEKLSKEEGCGGC
jgi:hypothetical protein